MDAVTHLRELLEILDNPTWVPWEDPGIPMTVSPEEYALARAAVNALPALLAVAEAARCEKVPTTPCYEGDALDESYWCATCRAKAALEEQG